MKLSEVAISQSHAQFSILKLYEVAILKSRAQFSILKLSEVAILQSHGCLRNKLDLDTKTNDSANPTLLDEMMTQNLHFWWGWGSFRSFSSRL